ncbi:MAG: class I SAM-dependent methyltransferase [Solirubrobacterales bacterium]|nr:class I SAM-dependent methyltransferase [Solirubrobacterales bacterium]
MNNAEILLPCLDAIGARSVVEVGASAGDLTRALLGWAVTTGARIWAIDPSPQESLVRLADENPNLELIRDTSHRAIPRIALPDAIVIDGDHNYFTVTGELRLIEEQAAGNALPLLMFHDVRWPHARRDHYYAPELIPADERRPIVNGGLFPGDAGVRWDGLPYTAVAVREGGPHNGVLTAVEDFAEPRDELQLAIVPTFFGLGVLWQRDSPWAEALAALLSPYDRHPVLERIEANRVFQLASMHSHGVQSMVLAEQNNRKDEFLRRMLDSRAFAIAERISRLWRRGEPAFSREEVRRLLDS